MKKVQLICSAHLDPVWLWRWPEGAAEALSTFRVAVDMIERHKGFVFNHNEALLYEWIEQFEPSLFEAIQRQVKAGRWVIMGGWFLQSDCTMPSGESFVRQIVRGKRYFQRAFGKNITTAINFDPFGHSRGLVQIMAKSGFDSYMFCRPGMADCSLPSEIFDWEGYDGSRILTCRIPGHYNSEPGKARAKIETCLNDFRDWDPLCILWGIGNHGGGPSRKDLAEVNKLIEQCRDIELSHSSPQQFFRQVRQCHQTPPVFRQCINPWAVGCYTSQVRIKQKHRLLENELYSAEKMCTNAWLEGSMSYPGADLDQIERDLLLSEFHDALPGSGIQEVEEDTLRQLDHGLELASRLKTRAFFALCAGQRKGKDGDCPLLVHNPHPYAIEKIVEAEIHLRDQGPSETYRHVKLLKGRRQITCQVEKESSNQNGEWRKKVVFHDVLKPGMNRYDCVIEEWDQHPQLNYPVRNGRFVFKTHELRVEINKRTGLLDVYKVGGKAVFAGKPLKPVILQDDADPWSMFKHRYGKVMGTFRAASRQEAAALCGLKVDKIDPVRVIEDGPVRTIIEAVLVCQESVLVMRYKLPRRGTEIELEARVYWNHKDRILKLAVPLSWSNLELTGQDAYGIKEMFIDGRENISQKWIMACDPKRDLAFTCVGDSGYGSDFCRGELRLSLLRSPAYSSGICPVKQDRFNPRMEQGERVFNFWLNASTLAERRQRIDREALVRNEKEYTLNFFPSGQGRLTRPTVTVSDSVVQVPVVKQSYTGRDVIVRLFEPTGCARRTTLKFPQIKGGLSHSVRLQRFELKTLRINPKTGRITETDLLENKSAER